MYDFSSNQKGLYVSLRPEDNLRINEFHDQWVQVRGKIVPPEALLLGGGDLTIKIRDSDMFALLENAEILAFDPENGCFSVKN